MAIQSRDTDRSSWNLATRPKPWGPGSIWFAGGGIKSRDLPRGEIGRPGTRLDVINTMFAAQDNIGARALASIPVCICCMRWFAFSRVGSFAAASRSKRPAACARGKRVTLSTDRAAWVSWQDDIGMTFRNLGMTEASLSILKGSYRHRFRRSAGGLSAIIAESPHFRIHPRTWCQHGRENWKHTRSDSRGGL